MLVKNRSWSLLIAPSLLRPLRYTSVLVTLIGGCSIGFAPNAWSALRPNGHLSMSPLATESSMHYLVAQNPSPPLLQFGSEGPDVKSIQSLLQLLGYYSDAVDGRYQESTVVAVSAFQSAAGLSEDGILGPTTWEKLLPSITQVQTSQEENTSNSASVASTPSSSSPSTPANTASGSDGNSSASNSDGSAAEAEADSEGNGDGGPTTSSSESVSNEDIRLPTLRLGMRGPAVQNLQERLSTLGLLQGTIDGVFGSQTEESVKSAQRYFDLVPDGVVGPATWRALLQ